MLAGLAMPEGKCEGFLDMLVPGEGIELKSIQFSISEGSMQRCAVGWWKLVEP